MRFAPYPCRIKREWTPLRVAAARRAVQREKDDIPLFPEMARFQNVKQRMKQVDSEEEGFILKMRHFQVWYWREARRVLRLLDRSHPIVARCVRSLWSRDNLYPPDPTYLASLIRKRCEAWGIPCQLRLYSNENP